MLLLSLASCTTPPPRPPAPATAVRLPAPAPASVPAAEQQAAAAPEPAPMPDLWKRLRDSFVMDDCNIDPAVNVWARRFTSNPRRFEKRMAESLPRLAYVQAIAEKHHIAGEFVLLPWVESHYRPVHGRGRQPGGIWQIVPSTAGSLGLSVNRTFDGRMDVDASTEAVMSLLRRYQNQFHDWRLTDYAYNAGEFSVRKLIAKHGAPPAVPSMPTLPVRRVTREHLVKLLAIACVVRSPERFQVTLPVLPDEKQLVAVPIPHPMSMEQAARHAGMPEDALRRFNSAFLTGRIDPDDADYLLLPDGRAAQFRSSVARLAQEPTARDDSPVTQPSDPPHQHTHTVRPGENLWLIARHHAVTVAQLRQWNHLRKDTVRPGQILLLAPGD